VILDKPRIPADPFILQQFLGTSPFLLAPNPCDHGLWPSARSIGAYSGLRAYGFRSFPSTINNSRSSELTNSRSRVDQQSTTTRHPTTDTHCGTSRHHSELRLQRASELQASELSSFGSRSFHACLLPISRILNFRLLYPPGPHSTDVTNSGGGTCHA
jgi:hypothetical protein